MTEKCKFIFKESGNILNYRHRLYSLTGDLIYKLNSMEIPCDSGYVLVGCEKYKCADYVTAFKKALQPSCSPSACSRPSC